MDPASGCVDDVAVAFRKVVVWRRSYWQDLLEDEVVDGVSQLAREVVEADAERLRYGKL